MKLPPAFRHYRFTLLWIGLLVSIAGSQMQLWALFWHVRTLSDQPLASGGVGAARFLPILIFSLVGGLVADRFNRRKVLFLTQTSMALSALGLGLLTWSGHIQLWHLYALTALQAVAGAFDLPARQALVPNLVPREDLPSAFSVQSIAFDVGAVVGPALSGLVVSSMGQHVTYLINAVSFLAVLLALALMGPVRQEVSRTSPQESKLDAIREGIRFILRQPIILSSMLLDFFATFFSSANTLLPFVARDVLHVGAVEYGWLAAAQSIGAIGTALVISPRTQIRRLGRLLLGSVILFGAATILFGLAHTFITTLLALILVGCGDAISTILRNTIRQMQTPDALRGRMLSINQIFFMGGPQLGEVEAGLVAQAFGTPAAIITGGIGCIVAVLWIGTRWPQLRRFNGDEPSLAGAAGD